MPVYEYECPACQNVLEVQQKMSDAPLSTCPDCGGELHKLISRSSFQLKGGGWYSDGYSASSPSSSASSEKETSPAKTPPCQGGTGTCESCPAA
ncbi:MAG: transcriptional regulator [Desulfobulbus propionicus]|nr:MAG: transcriptional regulator [Desulfobulbus propionicus]